MFGVKRKVQSVLVSKDKYPTEELARKYVKQQGYDDSFKLHPDQPKNNMFWRFRQYTPHDKAQYITTAMDDGKSKKVVELMQEEAQQHTKGLSDHRFEVANRKHRENRKPTEKSFGATPFDVLLHQPRKYLKEGEKPEIHEVDEQLKEIYGKGGNWMKHAPDLTEQEDWDKTYKINKDIQKKVEQLKQLSALIYKQDRKPKSKYFK